MKASGWGTGRGGREARAAFKLPMGIWEFLTEAEMVAKVAQDHWKPGPGRPGLEEIEPKLSAELPWEILDLARRTHALHTEVRSRTPGQPSRDLQRGRMLHRQLRDALRFHFQMEPGHSHGQVGQTLRTDSANVGTTARLAQSLSNLGRFAQDLGPAALVGLDAEAITEAIELAARLLHEGAPRDGFPASPQRPERDELLQQIHRRVQTLRQAFRFLYSGHPEILRLAASNSRRQSRRRQVAQQAARSAPQPETDPSTAVTPPGTNPTGLPAPRGTDPATAVPPAGVDSKEDEG